MKRWSGLTPMLQAVDVSETIDFYTAVLGFTLDAKYPETAPTWCSLVRGPVHLMFFAAEAVNQADVTPPAMSGVLYVYVDDVLDVHDELKLKTDVLWGPQAMPYGFLEFAIRECNGYTVSFGQRIH